MSFTAELPDLECHEMPVDAAGLAAALGRHDRYEARLALATASFERGRQWELFGFTSAAAWLRDKGMTRRSASELLKLGQRMRAQPITAAAWVAGEITGGQVRAICALVVDRHVARFAEHEHELIPHFATLSVDDTIIAMQEWRAKADALDDGPEPREETQCEATLSPTPDNRGHLTASLDAEGYALADAALRIADTHDLNQPAQLRRGQALKDVFKFFLDNQASGSGGRNRPHVNIVVKAETLGTGDAFGYVAETGMTLSPATIDRILCDCNAHRVVVANGAILDYGRSTKTPPINLYNAVLVRDEHCRCPACDRPGSWCDAHHVDWWERDQGETKIGNLVLLCSFHHTLIHKAGWSARLRENPWAWHMREVEEQRLIRARLDALKGVAA